MKMTSWLPYGSAGSGRPQPSKPLRSVGATTSWIMRGPCCSWEQGQPSQMLQWLHSWVIEHVFKHSGLTAVVKAGLSCKFMEAMLNACLQTSGYS